MKNSNKFVYLVCNETESKSNDLLSVFDTYDKALKNVKYEFYGEKIPRDQKDFNEKITIKENDNETLFKLNKSVFMKIIKVELNNFSINNKTIEIENLNISKKKNIKSNKVTKNTTKKEIIEFKEFKKEILDKIEKFETKLYSN